MSQAVWTACFRICHWHWILNVILSCKYSIKLSKGFREKIKLNIWTGKIRLLSLIFFSAYLSYCVGWLTRIRRQSVVRRQQLTSLSNYSFKGDKTLWKCTLPEAKPILFEANTSKPNLGNKIKNKRLPLKTSMAWCLDKGV